MWSSSTGRKKQNFYGYNLFYFWQLFYRPDNTENSSWLLPHKSQHTGLNITQHSTWDPLLSGAHIVCVAASPDVSYVNHILIWHMGSRNRRATGASLQQNNVPWSCTESGWRAFPTLHPQPDRYFMSCCPICHCLMYQRRSWSSLSNRRDSFFSQPSYQNTHCSVLLPQTLLAKPEKLSGSTRFQE